MYIIIRCDCSNEYDTEEILGYVKIYSRAEKIVKAMNKNHYDLWHFEFREVKEW